MEKHLCSLGPFHHECFKEATWAIQPHGQSWYFYACSEHLSEVMLDMREHTFTVYKEED